MGRKPIGLKSDEGSRQLDLHLTTLRAPKDLSTAQLELEIENLERALASSHQRLAILKRVRATRLANAQSAKIRSAIAAETRARVQAQWRLLGRDRDAIAKLRAIFDISERTLYRHIAPARKRNANLE